MNKNWLMHQIENTPQDLNSSYIFLVDDMDLALNILAGGFGVQALLEEPEQKDIFFTIEGFISYMKSLDNKGTSRMEYTYVAACSLKWKNGKLKEYFKENAFLNFHAGWKLFKEKKYYAKIDYQKDLKEELISFISQHEGPRGASKFSNGADNIDGSHLSDNETFNGWFDVTDTIRTSLHTFNHKDETNGVLDGAVVDYIISHVELFILDQIVFIYTSGCYKADPHGSQAKELIRSLLFPEVMKSTIINRIYAQLLDRVSLHRTSDQLNLQPAHWINFQNGFYDVLTQDMIDHSPRYYCTNQIPFWYDPDWKPPDNPEESNIVEKFLRMNIPNEEDRKMLWEFIGYSMTTDTCFQKFLTLTGSGGTGKSIVIKMMDLIVGKDNISNISLQDLNNRFYPSALHLKLLNTCADIPSLGMQNIDNLKKATGEDMLVFEKKGKDVGFFRSYAKLCFSANEIPLNLDEKSNAFYRRILILSMDRVIPPEDQDPHLQEKIRPEWEYILYKAICGLKRLHEQGHFTESDRSKAATRELRRCADNVQAFIDTCICEAPGKRIPRSRVYDAYEEYCRDNKRQSCGKTNFFKRFCSRFTLSRYGSDGYCFKDIELCNQDEKIDECFGINCEEAADNNGFLSLEPDEVTPFDDHPADQN